MFKNKRLDKVRLFNYNLIYNFEKNNFKNLNAKN